MSLHYHSLCNKPNCSTCNNTEGPVLCDAMVCNNGHHFITTQRERNIAEIVTFFSTTCGDDILDCEKLPAIDTNSFLWELAHTVVHHLQKNSKGWTYHVHKLSQLYPKDAILVEFYLAALHYKIVDSYRQFLHTNNLTHFLPTDLESVD